jgi:flagellar hook assembly protein FlgD
VSEKVETPKVKSSVRREAAGAKAHETGEPSLTFDRSESKSFEVRCWRAAASPAQLDIFAPHNRRVRTLKSEAGAAGWIKLPWDGKDESGKKVPTGLYFLRPSQEFEQSVRDIWVKG